MSSPSDQEVPTTARRVRVLRVNEELDEVVVAFGSLELFCFGFGQARSDDVGRELWATFSCLEDDDVDSWRLPDDAVDSIRYLGAYRYEIHCTQRGENFHVCGLVVGDDDEPEESDALGPLRVGVVLERLDIEFHR